MSKTDLPSAAQEARRQAFEEAAAYLEGVAYAAPLIRKTLYKLADRIRSFADDDGLEEMR